jgi:hypothetical protein
MKISKIPEIPLKPDPKTSKARAAVGFKWNEEAGKRHKLGGKPDWIQRRNQSPACPDCGKKMTFYGQLDSIGDEVAIADCGMIYVFVCFGCFETTSVLQSY